jgi:hypothetical protein
LLGSGLLWLNLRQVAAPLLARFRSSAVKR